MSGLEAVGLILSVVPIVISVADKGISFSKAANKLLIHDFAYDARTYGAFGLLVVLLVPEVNRVIQRIRVHLLDRGVDQGEVFKKPFTEGFTMVGIAGAIIAQIAFTGLSLYNISNTHWTAYAAFVVSLVAGCFSVYFSCTIQLILSSFHGSQELLDWITRPEGAHSRMPSLYAAILLVLPSQLLNISLGAFLVGLGIYLGFIYTKDLGEVAGPKSASAILIFYIVSTFMFLSMYGIPWGMKQFETLLVHRTRGGVEPVDLETFRPNGTLRTRRMLTLQSTHSRGGGTEPQQHPERPLMVSSGTSNVQEIERQHPIPDHVPVTANEPDSQPATDDAVAALRAIIMNQEEQLKLQRVLLAALHC